MNSSESVEKKKVNPSVSYCYPKNVLIDETLTRDEKIAILREWHYDAVRLQESATENMAGGEPDRLQSVSNALLDLGISPAEENNTMGSTGARTVDKGADHLRPQIAATVIGLNYSAGVVVRAELTRVVRVSTVRSIGVLS